MLLIAVNDKKLGYPQGQRASNIALSYGAKRQFDMLNRLGVDHECDRQTYGRTDGRTV